MSDDRRSTIAALGKALQVLESFGPRTPDLRITEIATLTGLNRSSAQRTLHTLIRCAYLKRDPASAAISLSHRCVALAHRYLAGSHLLDMAMLPLAELSSSTHRQCDLWIANGDDIVNIARMPSADTAAVFAPVGQRYAAAESAPGKAMQGIKAEDEDLARYGVTLDPGQAASREGTLAAPVFGADGQCIAAVSISAPLHEERTAYAHAVASTAQAISDLRIQPWARTFADQPLPDRLPAIPDDDDPLFISSVARGLRTLEAFAQAPQALTLTELHHVTGDPVPTLQRILNTLMQHGYIEKDPRHKTFRLSVRTLDLLFNFQMSDRVLKTIWPRLVRLREECRLHCSFCILDGAHIYHLLNVQAHPHAEFNPSFMGERLSALSTSGGRAMLSQRPEAEVEALLAEPVKAITPYTITDPAALREEIACARRRGFAFTDQQSILHEVNVAAPIVQADGQAIGAIVISAPRNSWDLARMEREAVPLLLPYTKSLFR